MSSRKIVSAIKLGSKAARAALKPEAISVSGAVKPFDIAPHALTPQKVSIRGLHTSDKDTEAAVAIIDDIIIQINNQLTSLSLLKVNLAGGNVNLQAMQNSMNQAKAQNTGITNYHVFYKYHYDKVAAANPDLEAQDITKIVSKMWGEMTKPEKKAWTIPFE